MRTSIIFTGVLVLLIASPIAMADDKQTMDTLWTLLAGVLVMFMQAGFIMLETGFTRAKNACNVAMKGVLDFCMAALSFWVVGFAIMFGVGNDFFGTNGFFLEDGQTALYQTEVAAVGALDEGKLPTELQALFAKNKIEFGDDAKVEKKDGHWSITDASGTTYLLSQEGKTLTVSRETFDSLSWTGVPLKCKYFFQMVFCATAATIVAGAVAERAMFVAYLLYSIIITAFIYPVVGHWIWGGGWLAQLGMHDFAGSTVVHSVGGWIALTGAVMLGPRIGKYNPDGSSNAIPGHNMPLATLGVFILWLGWFGFNPGSTMEALAEDIAHIATTTNIAAAAGAIGAMLISWKLFKKPDLSMTLNGVLAGLVAITAPCAVVSIGGAVWIGFIAGILVVLAIVFIDQVLRIDDPIGAVSVHAVSGTWGTFAVGLFDTSKGLFYGGGWEQLKIQVIGIIAVFSWCMIAGFSMFYVLKHLFGLRVSRREELRGLDIEEHGMESYPGFQIFTTQ